MIAVFGALVAAAAGLQWWRVSRDAGMALAIDGDSLRLDGAEIRLTGIDAPELDQTCERDGRPWRCGQAAKAYLAQQLAQGQADCRSSSRDRYGRKLAACRVNGVDVNSAMVRAGMAIAYGGYEREEAEARDARRGVWASRFDAPQEWRRAHPRGPHGPAAPTPGSGGAPPADAPLPPARPAG